MTAAPKSKADPGRRAALAKIHIAKKQLGLEDEAYRSILRRVAGQGSAGKCDARQLGAVLEELRRLGFRDSAKPSRTGGRRRLAEAPQHRKIRALWLSLWNLGAVEDSGEAALGAFVQRQTGVAALQWATPEALNTVVEALKDWAAREGVDWSLKERVWKDGLPDDRHNPRRSVVEAQWRKLLERGAIRHAEFLDVQAFGYRVTSKGGFQFYGPGDWDRLMSALGRMIREAKR